uniref:Retrotransposon gag protein n=1 Tax=Solanum tuberosum TaxID=4113 RepID=M1D8P2_SOLTU
MLGLGEKKKVEKGEENFKVRRFLGEFRVDFAKLIMPPRRVVRVRPARRNIEEKWGSVAQEGNWAPACAKCGRTHLGKWRDGSTGCFKCGQEGHFMIECPKNRQGASLSFVTPYAANNFDVLREKLCELFCVSSPIVESILAERVYHDCVISINHKNTMFDLVELDMVDLDVILCMDWLHAYFDFIDCRTRVVRFQIPNEPVIEWSSSSAVPKYRLIAYLKARKFVSKGCIYHLVRVNNSSVELIMPIRRDFCGRPAMRNIEEQGVPNAPEVQPQGKVTNVEFREAIQMLSQAVTNQVGKQRGARHEVVDTLRIRDFLRINPPSFTGSSSIEDLENFIEKLQKVFEVMHVVDVERVELAAYQLKNVARTWFD